MTISSGNIPNIFDNFDTNDTNIIPLVKWLKISLLNRVFSTGCGWIPYRTGIRNIHSVMAVNKGKPFPYNQIINVYRNHPIHNFSSVIDKNSILYFDTEYMLFMLYGDSKKTRSEDIDHIHPKSILKMLDIDEEKINSIVNYQLIESGTNRNIKRNKELYLWIENDVNPNNRKNYILRNFIPNNETMWYSENFGAFYNARSEIIAHLLNKRFNEI